MLVTDPRLPDDPIVLVNQAFTAMTGYAPEEILGLNCRLLQGPLTDPATIDAIRGALESHQPIEIDILNYRKNGTSFWNKLFISPVFDKSGELIYFFSSQLDVSRWRDAEDALGQKLKMEALGQLTGGISHDFNNLLQVMLGQIELLDRRLRREPIDVSALTRASQSIRNAIGKATGLTQQLLAFARKQRLDSQLSNLNTLTINMVELAQRTIGDELLIVPELDPQLHNCRIDPTQFELALLNVVLNARDAMQGQGVVKISTTDVTVDAGDVLFDGIAGGEYVCCTVTDTGSGIAPENINHVTEPFFTTKEEGKGTGLGLSMVYGFVKQSNGHVQIDSEVGVGTTLRMYFPAVRDQEEQAATPAPHRQLMQGGHETILVVDDRKEVQELSTTVLEELGYRVIGAESGLGALALVKSLDPAMHPALLFSDVIMPGGMNGYVLAREMRERYPAIKVLLTTGYAGTDDGSVVRGTKQEFDVIKKPHTLEELAHRVRTVLDRSSGAH